MPWNLLILPLVGGYYIISRYNYFKFKQQRLDRQRLIFDSVIMGVVLISATFIVRVLVEFIAPTAIDWVYQFFPVQVPFIGTTFTSLLLAFLFVEIGNKTFCKDRRKQIEKAIKKVGNELELILSSSFRHSKLLEFTLDTNKFYIGWVKELPIPTVSDYIRIIPVFSGYRDEEKRFVFTTHYLNVYGEYIQEGRIRDIKELETDLILTLDNVVSLSYFDIEMYERFQRPAANGMNGQGNDDENHPEDEDLDIGL